MLANISRVDLFRELESQINELSSETVSSDTEDVNKRENELKDKKMSEVNDIGGCNSINIVDTTSSCTSEIRLDIPRGKGESESTIDVEVNKIRESEEIKPQSIGSTSLETPQLSIDTTSKESQAITKNSNTISYDSLTEEEKHFLAVHSCRMIKKRSGKWKIVRFYLFIKKKLFGKTNDKNYFPKKSVNPFIYELIDYLKVNGAKERGIFRLGGRPSVYNTVPHDIQRGERIDFTKYDITNLASILKAYVREVLDGLLPLSPCKAMYRCISNESREDLVLHLKKYFPWCIPPQERRLFIALQDLFSKINDNAHTNYMTTKNILLIVAPTIFPSKSVSELNDALLQVDILVEVFGLNYKDVPLDVFESVKKKYTSKLK
ncbi:rho GTPase-activating protein gacGG-like [Nylanderia fulva]|uniref:rho GTPase-activating protein gacGG-like n=1 Tax=Nylanderia fulva TaxID=613905 RepID=UPI0010FAD221|nr:rho GTPase-activating protein gacGG-like [Nylanderia fulva]